MVHLQITHFERKMIGSKPTWLCYIMFQPLILRGVSKPFIFSQCLDVGPHKLVAKKLQALPCCDAIGSAVSVWTSSLVFLSRWCVCVCVSFVLLFFVFFVMGWFGFFALLWLVSKFFWFSPRKLGKMNLFDLYFQGGWNHHLGLIWFFACVFSFKHQ